MTDATARSARRVVPSADAALRGAAILWFCVAAVGQLAFIVFIALFYGPSTVLGHFEAWNEKPLITGYVAGDTAGNLMFGVHVLLAAVMTAAGLLQLVPTIRRRAPRLHRWSGRVFLTLAVTMALGGLWLVWGRGTYLTLAGAISISMDAALILLFAALTLRYAIARRIDRHRRWALRLFMVGSGVWFQRVGYMAWILINGAPVGIGPRMSGPFDIAWGFGQFLLPLAMLELYLLASARGVAGPLKAGVAALLVTMTGVMAVGIFGAIMGMWLPYL